MTGNLITTSNYFGTHALLVGAKLIQIQIQFQFCINNFVYLPTEQNLYLASLHVVTLYSKFNW